jgi:hypothetical protein
MKYGSQRERKQSGVCIVCEGAPVVQCYRCLACYATYRDASRKEARKRLKCLPRQIWNPETQVFVSIDDRDGYDAVRAKIAREMDAGAKGWPICEKYKLSWPRLRKICVEHGVTSKRKQGGWDHPKTPERVALEASVLADARAGMCLRDLRTKYPGHAVSYICVRAGVTVTKQEGHHAESRC